MQNIYDYQGNVVPLAESFDYNKYIYGDTGLLYDSMTGLKVLYLSGDMSGMSGDVKKDMTWSFDGQTGTCTVKWQGSSSQALIKKNYSLKLGSKADWGHAWGRDRWGSQKKYVLKANYNDFSHAVYMCAARLWGEIVNGRGSESVPQQMLSALNYGTVDGFPVMLVINNVYVGLYTIMTHKEIVTNVDAVGGFFVVGQQTDALMTMATSFSRHTSASNLENEADFECVNSPNEDDLSDVANSLNSCIDAVMQTGASWKTDLADYLDAEAAIDYFLFRCLLGDKDGYTKNQGLVSYNGTKWYHTVYDLDHCFGSTGTHAWHPSPVEDLYSYYAQRNRVFNLIFTYSKADIKNRYQELRNGSLSLSHVYELVSNYINDIPLGLYVQEDKLWPLTPNSSTASLHQIAEWYRLRCQWSDNYIDAL